MHKIHYNQDKSLLVYSGVHTDIEEVYMHTEEEVYLNRKENQTTNYSLKQAKTTAQNSQKWKYTQLEEV